MKTKVKVNTGHRNEGKEGYIDGYVIRDVNIIAIVVIGKGIYQYYLPYLTVINSCN